MSISEVDICNRGLLKIHSGSITRLRPPENTEESRACFTVYDQLLDEVLRAHPWNFAIAQESLQLLSEPPQFNFNHAYQLPTDCLRVLRLDDNHYKYRFKIKGDQLHTDVSGAKIEYIKRITDPNMFDSLFTSTLSTRIAMELAYALAGSAERTEQLSAEYSKLLKEAKRRDGQEGSPDPITAERFIDSRTGGRYW